MRISDWSSYVCSSDLVGAHQHQVAILFIGGPELTKARGGGGLFGVDRIDHGARQRPRDVDRGIDALFGQGARQDDMPVDDRARRIDDGEIGRAAWRERGCTYW